MKKIIRVLLALVLAASTLLIQASPGIAAAAQDTQTIYFTAPSGWNNANFYSWDSEGTITSSWPGDAMTRVSGNLYSCTLPADAVNIIFNNGSTQTQDLTIPSGKNWYDYSAGTWSAYKEQCAHPGHNTDGNCTECGTYLGHSYVGGICTACGAKASWVSAIPKPRRLKWSPAAVTKMAKSRPPHTQATLFSPISSSMTGIATN